MCHRLGIGWVSVLVASGLSWHPGQAQAQQMAPAGTSSGSSSPNSSMLSNPYANPYLNPFLNPYMTQQPMNGNAAAYLFAAQQANGGIGSGQISGVRPAKSAKATTAAKPAETKRHSDIPGANASRYFNRGYQPAAITGRFYDRQGRYHPSNTH